MNETSEWYHSFELVSKSNGKVQLCLDPARLNKVLIRPVQRGLMLRNILSRLTDIKHPTLRDAGSGYHDQKPDENYYI